MHLAFGYFKSDLFEVAQNEVMMHLITAETRRPVVMDMKTESVGDFVVSKICLAQANYGRCCVVCTRLY